MVMQLIYFVINPSNHSIIFLVAQLYTWGVEITRILTCEEKELVYAESKNSR